MNRHTVIDRVEVISKDGQKKEYLEQKNMLFIGCDAGQNISLETTYPQDKEWLIQAIAKPTCCLLVSLSARPIEFRLPHGLEPADEEAGAQGATFLTHGSTEYVAYGREVRVDGFGFIFHRKRSARSIDVDFTLPQPAELTQAHTLANPLEGTVTLRNKGSETNVQFQITEVEGWAANAYHLDSPQPKLAYTRERMVKLFLYHPARRYLRAGHYYIGIRVTADQYPGEVATDFQEIYVRPFYDHTLEFEGEFSGRVADSAAHSGGDNRDADSVRR